LIAGAVEVVIQSVVRVYWLDDPKLFARNFQGPLSEITTISDRYIRFLNDVNLASLDEENTAFMDKKARLRFFCLRAARKLGNADGIAEYSKPLVYPDVMSRYLFPASPRYNAIFEKHFSFRTWSRWETVLFLPVIPDTSSFLLGKKDIAGENMPDIEMPLSETSNCTTQRNRFQKYIKGVFMFTALKKFFQGFGVTRTENLVVLSFRIAETIVEMGVLLVPVFFICFYLFIFVISLYNLFRDKCVSISAFF
jgi:hypothetical protein